MIRLAVISGKGGTGKTMITAALSQLLTGKLVLADCDVDAANLELLLSPRLIRTEPFMGMKTAVIDPALCTQCGECESHCRFSAIERDGDAYTGESASLRRVCRMHLCMPRRRSHNAAATDR